MSFVLCACQKEKEEEEMEKENSRLPQTLEQVEELSEEIVNSTMKKDWAKSTQKVKELHSKWNEFYPEAQKKGLSKDKTDAFNADLNQLTGLLITKTLSITGKDFAEDYIKQQENQDTQDDQTQNQESQDNQEHTNSEDQKHNEQQNSGENPAERNDENQDKNSKEKEMDPREVIIETAPLALANEDELIIVNASIQVTKHVPVFMSLFEGKIPPDALKLKYLIRHIDISSQLQKWDLASEDMSEALETWIYVQPKVIELKDTLGIQIQQGLTELAEVVSLKDPTLIHIKSSIVIKNLEDTIDEFKNK